VHKKVYPIKNKFIMNKISLTLISAKNLYNPEWFGTIDPYVHITSSSKSDPINIKSNIVKNSESPSFDQKFTFQCNASEEVLCLDSI
jgi:Ca2+-dependent lipid-binding protein